MSKAIPDNVRANKELMLCHQKERQSLTQYVAECKACIVVIKGAGGYPGQHAAAERLVTGKQNLVLSTAPNDKVVENAKVAAECYLAALLLDGLSNAKYAELKTHVTNRALEGVDSVPKSSDQVLKLAGGW